MQIGKQPRIASRRRRRRLPSSKCLSAAALLRPVPKSELLRNLESKFAVSEWLAKLLRKASIDLHSKTSRVIIQWIIHVSMDNTLSSGLSTF